MSDIKKTITLLLNELREGDQKALDKLIPIVYNELRKLAANHISYENGVHTLQATELVSEAYLKLIGQKKDVAFENREHLLRIFANTMRQYLIDYARRRNAKKRGEGLQKITLYEEKITPDGYTVDAERLEDALKALEDVFPRKCRIVELRWFTGLKIEEVASLLDISVSTVKKDWKTAKKWLLKELRAA